MPLQRGKDSEGSYYRWGATGKKYHYVAGNKASRERAQVKAMTQARAIEASKSRARKGGAERITRSGKLGGPGYLKKPAAERHKLLDKCVVKDGYHSCLGSILVLNENREIKALHGPKIIADAAYLKRKYGAKTGGTRPKKKKSTISSTARAKKKVADKGHATTVATYRHASIDDRP